MRTSGVIMTAAVLSALLAGEAALRLGRSARAAAMAQTPTALALIRKGDDGHFWAVGRAGGHQARFLVDTGATSVALTLDDARELGVDVSHLSFDRDVVTASGDAKAAHAVLPQLSVGPATVASVDVLIIDKGLPSSLLGMSYLGRLKSFEASQNALILHP